MITILVDTNVLVYAYDQSERSKQRQAIDVLGRIVAAGSGALSTQTLSEFYSVATRKLSPPLTPAQAEAQLRHFESVAGVRRDPAGGAGSHPRCAGAQPELLGRPDLGCGLAERPVSGL